MINTNPQSIEEVSRKAEEIYNLKKQELEAGENETKYVAIEVNSGDLFIGETRDEAVIAAKKKYPDTIVFVRRIGAIEKISRHFPLPIDKDYARML